MATTYKGTKARTDPRGDRLSNEPLRGGAAYDTGGSFSLLGIARKRTQLAQEIPHATNNVTAGHHKRFTCGKKCPHINLLRQSGPAVLQTCGNNSKSQLRNRRSQSFSSAR